MKQLITDLQSSNVGEVRFNEPLAEYTTWKIGGPADVFLIPKGKEELINALKILYEHQVPWTTIGRGSNMLVSDKGIRGVVIKLGEGLNDLRFEDELVYVGGAYSFIKLSVMSGKKGLTGLEFAGGIPGTVGGAVYMNAGAHGSDVSQTLLKAEVVLETGELVQWNAEELQFAYRYSKLHKVKGIVTEAVFKLKHGDRKEIAAAMASYKDRRLRTQPLHLAVAGSVFRNPENNFAAKLIEQSGLKGKRCGNAEVSMQHANFIVNTGQATARDVLTLIEQIQMEVFEGYGIQLIPEVLLVGER
jgi:UDP-N-acetylmuramate dehydrogenase